MPYPLRFGLGVGLPVKERPSPNPRTCWWGGAGGSAIRMDLDDHIGFGYVMNKMVISSLFGDQRIFRFIQEIYKGLR